jgi:hypothetical protein
MNLFERLLKGVVEDYFVSHDSTFVTCLIYLLYWALVRVHYTYMH